MRLTVQQLRYFLKTAEMGSVSKAAQALEVSQSTLSEALSQAELILGFAVLLRSRKGVAPTPLGGEFLEYAQRVISNMDALEARFGLANGGRPRFGVSSVSFGFAWEALLKISRYPENKKFEVCWYLDIPSQVFEHVNTQQTEIGLINLTPGQERASLKMVEDANLEFHELLQARLFAMVNPEHPLVQKNVVTDEELQEYPFYSVDQFAQTELLRNRNERTLSETRADERKAYGIKAPNGVLISPALLAQSIAPMNGYTVWCRYLPNSFTRDDVVSIPIDTDNRLVIGYVCRKNQKLSQTAQQLLDAIREFGDGSTVPGRLSSRPYAGNGDA